ncbi:MAG: hypothetical protein AAF654_10255 [Myxococcota bacterium]
MPTLNSPLRRWASLANEGEDRPPATARYWERLEVTAERDRVFELSETRRQRWFASLGEELANGDGPILRRTFTPDEIAASLEASGETSPFVAAVAPAARTP